MSYNNVFNVNPNHKIRPCPPPHFLSVIPFIQSENLTLDNIYPFAQSCNSHKTCSCKIGTTLPLKNKFNKKSSRFNWVLFLLGCSWVIHMKYSCIHWFLFALSFRWFCFYSCWFSYMFEYLYFNVLLKV